MATLRRACLVIALLVVGVVGEAETNKAKQNGPPSFHDRRLNEIPPFERQSGLRQPVAVVGLTWSSCGSKDDPIQLQTLTVPHVINLKGSFNFSADVAITRQISSPIKVTLKVQRHFLLFWITVPCIDHQFGSCTFSDACHLVPLTNGTCPPVFVRNHIPCVCPLAPAEYSVQDVPVDLADLDIPDELVSARYNIRALIQDGSSGQRLGCYTLGFVLQ